ncbi:MAG: Phenylalanyl-tRNA synthetase alpha chain [Brockia lithotrophica]|uniref:Phenylalanine--tRNA ligase alpha subunit n=1 Tax=Brockia lithotrophica TaxID=933949 RepID=A0A2T5GAB4_9BACL|nr:MAG: Phenylalanyl-tRNA synthetase alpha chain [Brockia lithotrophica]
MDFQKLDTSELERIASEARARIALAADEATLEGLRVEYLGKRGVLSLARERLRELPPEERPAAGRALNAAWEEVERAYEERRAALRAEETKRRLEAERLDLSLPGEPYPLGAAHPILRVIEEIEEIFLHLGYSVVEGPEVEWDLYNFERLNIPPDHPARDMQDSFYLAEDVLLRTHTSPVQVRTLLARGGGLPVRIVAPGTVYRRDEDDATHSHMFTQVEGLVVDEGVSLADLKGTLLAFARAFFGEGTRIRLRPSFFPFTEPSVEVDVSCHKCGGVGCNVCKFTGWIEVLGAGMVHPEVLRGAGYDPERVSGFAFGLGVERLAMIKYGVEDIRSFYTGDVRFLRPFRVHA